MSYGAPNFINNEVKTHSAWYKIENMFEEGVSYANRPIRSKYLYFKETGELVDYKNSKPEDDLFRESDHILEWKNFDKLTSVDLPGGFYLYRGGEYLGGDDFPERLVKIDIRNDMYVQTANKTYYKFKEDLKGFLDSESVYRELKILYKRGWLFYGPPGEGKTCLIRQVLHSSLPENSVTIFVDNIHFINFPLLRHIKKTLANRLKVFIFEELTEVLNNGSTNLILDFVDGEKSVDKSILIATTNYPEKLEMNIVDRPSRFDKLYKIDKPDKEIRRELWKSFLNGDSTTPNLDKYVEISDGFSVAAIKEACLYSKIKGISIETSIEESKNHSRLAKKNFKEGSSVGFDG